MSDAMTDDELDDEAPTCDADVVEQADFVLNYKDRAKLMAAGFEWDALVEELRDELVSARAQLSAANARIAKLETVVRLIAQARRLHVPGRPDVTGDAFAEWLQREALAALAETGSP